MQCLSFHHDQSSVQWYNFTFCSWNSIMAGLEGHQSLCHRIIYLEIQWSSLRTETASNCKSPTQHWSSHATGIRHTTKIANNDSLLPPRQSAIGRHSSRLVDKRHLTARTSLKMRSVFSLLELLCFFYKFLYNMTDHVFQFFNLMCTRMYITIVITCYTCILQIPGGLCCSVFNLSWSQKLKCIHSGAYLTRSILPARF